jgi:hypothetical protein
VSIRPLLMSPSSTLARSCASVRSSPGCARRCRAWASARSCAASTLSTGPNMVSVAMPSWSAWNHALRSSAASWWRASRDSGWARSRATRARTRNLAGESVCAAVATASSNRAHASAASSGRMLPAAPRRRRSGQVLHRRGSTPKREGTFREACPRARRGCAPSSRISPAAPRCRAPRRAPRCSVAPRGPRPAGRPCGSRQAGSCVWSAPTHGSGQAAASFRIVAMVAYSSATSTRRGCSQFGR